MPTPAEYVEQATAVADTSAPAGPTPEAIARAHDLVGRHPGRQVADRPRQVSRQRVVTRLAPEPYSPLPSQAPLAAANALWQGVRTPLTEAQAYRTSRPRGP
jgi:hypothetical protein